MRLELRRVLGCLALALVLAGCDLLGGGGGGGGGGAGGGNGNLVFAKGFTYVRRDDRNVYVVDDADYQTSGVLTTGTGVQTPSFSKDAKSIVFARKNGTETELAIVATEGGSARTVMSSTALVKNLRTPVFSPDGARIAFAYDDGSSTSIGLVKPDGTEFAKLIGGGVLGYASPSWSGDGLTILASAGNAGLPYTQLEKVDVASGTPSNVTNTLGLEAQSFGNRVVMSPDGTRAVFDARLSSGVTRIFLIDLGTKQVTKLNDYVGEPGTNDSHPAWIDAATVAFSSDSGGNDNVYRVSVTGTSRKLLVPKAIEAWYGPLP